MLITINLFVQWRVNNNSSSRTQFTYSKSHATLPSSSPHVHSASLHIHRKRKSAYPRASGKRREREREVRLSFQSHPPEQLISLIYSTHEGGTRRKEVPQVTVCTSSGTDGTCSYGSEIFQKVMMKAGLMNDEGRKPLD